MQTTNRTGKIVSIGQLLPEQLQEPVRFDEVELTEEETDQALNEARKKKHDRLEHERLKALAEARKNDHRRPWTPNELYEYCAGRATQMLRFESGNELQVFEPTLFQQPVILALSLYFTGDKKFEALDPKQYNQIGLEFKLNKGIWLWGNPGVGKSLLMQMFSRNRRLCYQVVQCPKIVAGYVKHGDDHIARYGRLIEEADTALSFYQTEQGICYNDLGVETVPAKHYGTPVNVMESIFLDTYENKVPFWHRHVTTNLTIDQLKETYGIRFVDRIKQCFNIIEVHGESLRK